MFYAFCTKYILNYPKEMHLSLIRLLNIFRTNHPCWLVSERKSAAPNMTNPY